MAGESVTTPTTLGGIAAILQALAWPTVAVLFFLVYRTKVGSLIDILAQKLKEAKRVKAGQIEIDTAEEISQVVNQTGEEASTQKNLMEVPKSQIQAARLVGDKLNAAPIAFNQKLEVANRQIYDLIDQYERVRRDIPSGQRRTRIMNEITAKMRALSIAARPLLDSLMAGERPGERLAAICILQVSPELGYFYWLIDRVMQEDQPFIFFHASLAIFEVVKAHPYLSDEKATGLIRGALDRISGFQGGPPDQNTIDVLNQALAKLSR